jgi:hypothetical protein
MHHCKGCTTAVAAAYHAPQGSAGGPSAVQPNIYYRLRLINLNGNPNRKCFEQIFALVHSSGPELVVVLAIHWRYIVSVFFRTVRFQWAELEQPVLWRYGATRGSTLSE